MYLCLECDNIFDEPKRYTETHGLASPPYETWEGCPYCGEMYVETCQCDICGNWVNGEYVECKDGTIICEDCYSIKHIGDGI